MIHIAVDIGASSGRLVAGEIKEGKLAIKEIHRFSNGFEKKDGTYYWDIDYIMTEILQGLSVAKSLGFEECTVGIDTWAVDYVLLDQNGDRLQDVVAYRDHRTDKTIEKLTNLMSKEEIYRKTGIQFLPFNTIYQLFEEDQELLQNTDKILMIPDYLGYRLTGNAVTEVTNASTTQLLNIDSRAFDEELLELISVKKEQFAALIEPGTELGLLKQEWFPEYDLPECKIITVASHDTASAIVGTPGDGENWAYLSSGTWSLIGIENHKPFIDSYALADNYTNEWGAFGTFRFLKNIMGLWILQEVRRKLNGDFSFEQLVEEAKQVQPFQQFINFNDHRFLNPVNMIEEIQEYCRETNQSVPESAGELASAVFNNLAIIYAIALEDLERITSKQINRVHIVGGGANNEFLNQLTANLSGKTVYAGPSEATAIGNLIVQLIALNELEHIESGRQLVIDSFEIKKFIPNSDGAEEIIQQFKRMAFSQNREEIK
ncbi:rhamnulokinase [Lederbergia citrea]|uniref:rhamnulokinase n=1 Tax=Lederbergia citrea TaxID=2833581 RepID=UPI001BCA1C72|nr:rhamnulokinase [Lederbergia citrea]MBS4176814.1 rhamnulokinase [Lederbergia citrea]